MSENPTIMGEDGQSLAAEYVLGVLDAQTRRIAEQRLATDKAFAAEVAFWEERLGGLAQEIAPVTPSGRVWSRIDAALTPARQSAGLWNSLLFWRWLAFASAALATAMLAVAYIGIFAQKSTPLMATLEANGRTGFFATIEQGQNTITIVPAVLPNIDQRALELWLIVPGDRPRSLGLIEASRPVRITVPAALAGRVTANTALAVSLEPPGGSPTGAPTGPVIASGTLTNL